MIRDILAGSLHLDEDLMRRNVELFFYRPLTGVMMVEQNSGGISVQLTKLVEFILKVVNMPLPEIPFKTYSKDDPPPKQNLAFFPQLPILRSTVNYHQNAINKKAREKKGKKSKKGETTVDEETEELKEDHIKCVNNHASIFGQTGGMIVVTCRHGLSVGIQFLTEVESVRHMFDLLAQRLPLETFKKTVLVYDNACKMMAYVYNRSPAMFSGFMAVSDIFHGMVSHRSCNEATMISFHEAYLASFGIDVGAVKEGIASSRPESVNAELRRKSNSVLYSNMPTHMAIVKSFVINRNLILKGRLFNSTRSGRRR